MATDYVIIDHILNWFLITPLVVCFWTGTYLLQDLLVFNLFSSKFIGTILVLLFGISVEFIIIYYQNEIHDFAKRLSSFQFVVFTRAYNYTVASANIAHYRGVQEIYDGVFGANDYESAVQTTVTVVIILWGIRASRNITGAPFDLSLDTNHNDWFKSCTLYATEASGYLKHLGDVLFTVLMVGTLSPLHWITLGYIYDLSIFPNNFFLAAVISLVVGYGIVATFSYFQYNVQEWSKFYDSNNRWIFKTLLEDIFIWGATAGVILSWKGWGMFFAVVREEYPTSIFGFDTTALGLTLVPFIILCCLHVSGCLVVKGAEMDGSSSGGEGISFSRSYVKEVSELWYGSSQVKKKNE